MAVAGFSAPHQRYLCTTDSRFDNLTRLVIPTFLHTTIVWFAGRFGGGGLESGRKDLTRVVRGKQWLVVRFASQRSLFRRPHKASRPCAIEMNLMIYLRWWFSTGRKERGIEMCVCDQPFASVSTKTHTLTFLFPPSNLCLIVTRDGHSSYACFMKSCTLRCFTVFHALLSLHRILSSAIWQTAMM
jgi:hypothetical protein